VSIDEFYNDENFHKQGWNNIIMSINDFENIRSEIELKFILSRRGMPFKGLFLLEMDDKIEYARDLVFIDGHVLYHWREK
jgi:hypothetical protein